MELLFFKKGLLKNNTINIAEKDSIFKEGDYSYIPAKIISNSKL